MPFRWHLEMEPRDLSPTHLLTCLPVCTLAGGILSVMIKLLIVGGRGRELFNFKCFRQREFVS